MNEWDVKSFEWDLRPESQVVECGAFHGRWALEIAQRYNPHLYLFEPQGWLAQELRTTFRAWQKVKIFSFGLGTETRKATLWNWGNDGATFIECRDARDGGGEAYLQEISETFLDLDLMRPDLMLINIEGYEFQLIPYMLGKGILPRQLMVQMHVSFGNELSLRQLIQTRYQLFWDYGATLSAWERREPNP